MDSEDASHGRPQMAALTAAGDADGNDSHDGKHYADDDANEDSKENYLLR